MRAVEITKEKEDWIPAERVPMPTRFESEIVVAESNAAKVS
jgi:hypothetical protein